MKYKITLEVECNPPEGISLELIQNYLLRKQGIPSPQGRKAKPKHQSIHGMETTIGKVTCAPIR